MQNCSWYRLFSLTTDTLVGGACHGTAGCQIPRAVRSARARVPPLIIYQPNSVLASSGVLAHFKRLCLCEHHEWRISPKHAVCISSSQLAFFSMLTEWA